MSCRGTGGGPERLIEPELAAMQRAARDLEKERDAALAREAVLMRTLNSLELLEQLAALEHTRWSGWMHYQNQRLGQRHAKTGEFYTERWARQASTPYGFLPENERESDRVEVQKTLDVIRAALATPSPAAEALLELVDLAEQLVAARRFAEKTGVKPERSPLFWDALDALELASEKWQRARRGGG